MIIKVDDIYHSKVINYLKREPDFNLFIIGDIERYGYDNYFLDIWADIDKKGHIEGVLLRYFEYLIFYSQGNFNIDEFANLINSLNYIEISGKLDVLQKLERKICVNRKRIVKFCVLDDSSKLNDIEIGLRPKKIRFGNINKVAKLYEEIDEFENTTVVSRLIEGEYFKIDQMLSSDYDTKVRINKRELLDCIDRATLLVKEGDKKPIIMNITDGNMELRINSLIGSMNEDIDIDKDGKDIMIGFNPKFFIDALRVIDEEEVNLYMVNPKAPCFIKDDEGKFIYLILPVNFNTAAN